MSEGSSASGSAFAPYFSRWRQVALGGRVVVEGCVDPAHAAPSAELGRAIERWPGIHYWQRRGSDRWLLLVDEAAAPRERWWLHALLLVITVVSAAVAAAGWGVDGATEALAATIERGLPFAVPFVAIIAAHELGHYVAARRYRVDVSPPYFLPMLPPALNLVGSLGAFVRLRSPVYDRRTLFDVAFVGPLAGLLVATVMLAVGLSLSSAEAGVHASRFAHQFVMIDGRPMLLGDSAAIWALRRAMLGDVVVRMHPVAVAGWVGLLVTMLDLLPLTQFDGGHIAFAVLGRPQRWLAWLAVVTLVAAGALLWSGWWAWAVLALVTGRGRLAHPRLVSAEARLDGWRRWAGLAALAALALCIAPVPLRWG